MTAELTETSRLIVGGSGAMGAALAARIVEAGGEVVLAGRDAGSIARAAASLGAGVRTVAADATTEAGAAQIVAASGVVDHVAIVMSSGGSGASSISATDLVGSRGPTGGFGRR